MLLQLFHFIIISLIIFFFLLSFLFLFLLLLLLLLHALPVDAAPNLSAAAAAELAALVMQISGARASSSRCKLATNRILI